MIDLTCIVFVLAIISVLLDGVQLRDTCTVSSYSQIENVVSNCSKIIVDGITVPAGKILMLNLRNGTHLTFRGVIKFEYKQWGGPLVKILGKEIIVEGDKDSVLDGQGALYWDGIGNQGPIKPRFMRIKASNSQINNINLLNCPTNCVSIGNSHELTLNGWNIDCSDGDSNGGHNTDGFDISSSTNIVLKDSVVQNQDDCVAVSQGSNLKFSGLYCSGSHGLSLSVGMNSDSSSANTVSDVVFSNCTVTKSRNGIHIKTHINGAPGYIKNVTYTNIILSGISYYGINVQEDYNNGGSTGSPKGNIPISDLQMTNIKGDVTGSHGIPVYILCGDNGCSDWSWSEVSISGVNASYCNFIPTGFSC